MRSIQIKRKENDQDNFFFLISNCRRSKLATPNLFLGSEPHVRALVWLGVKWENDARFTVVQPMGPTST